MKYRYAERDTLYKSMDELVDHYNGANYKPPYITLDRAQYELFIDFNNKTEGELYYRNIKVKKQ